MRNLKWDHRFMRLALEIASWSKDPSTQVGAVVIDHQRRIIGEGYNGFPRGVDDDPARYLEKMVKYKMVVHAEANALITAVRSVVGCTLYATKFPCTECAKLIIQTGVATVVAPPLKEDGTVWAEDGVFSKQMFKEAFVEVYEWLPEDVSAAERDARREFVRG